MAVRTVIVYYAGGKIALREDDSTHLDIAESLSTLGASGLAARGSGLGARGSGLGRAGFSGVMTAFMQRPGRYA